MAFIGITRDAHVQAGAIIHHFESSRGVLLMKVQPHGAGVAKEGLDLEDILAAGSVGIQFWPIPANAVLGRGVAEADSRAGHVPHLQRLVFRVVPNAATKRRGKRESTARSRTHP